jgi:hypothetical protein
LRIDEYANEALNEFVEAIRNCFLKLRFLKTEAVHSIEQGFVGKLNYLLLFEKIKVSFINKSLPILLTVNQQ